MAQYPRSKRERARRLTIGRCPTSRFALSVYGLGSRARLSSQDRDSDSAGAVLVFRWHYSPTAPRDRSDQVGFKFAKEPGSP